MDTTHDTEQAPAEPLNRFPQPVWKRTAAIAAALIALVLLLNLSYIGYLYAATPLDIRQPLYEHYHFRLQLLLDGKAVDFGSTAFQEGYSKDNCNAALTAHPIHFHDGKSQFVHIHWEGMTGGQVLKYYGWDMIGGAKGSLGYRFDTFPKLQKVAIHGNALPPVPAGDNFYVYSGDQDRYRQRSIDEYLGQDLEKFFNKVSNSPSHQLNKQKRKGLAELLQPKAYALAAADPSIGADPTADDDTTAPVLPEQSPQMIQSAATTGSGLNTEQLTRLNNLIGNVVIFVQKQKPTDAQIKDRFNHLEPLSESTCGG